MDPINKYGIFLHLVEESDAEFIFALRTNPKLNNYISFISPNISDQIKWIQDYKIKEKQGLEYYYIAKDINGNKYGTIRLYNFDEKSFELGSWVFLPNSPLGMAVKTHIIALELGYEMLNADYCRLNIRKNNFKVLRYFEDFKPFKEFEDDLNFYFTISKENFYHRRNQLGIIS